jgi:hypothetical protein
MTLYAATIFLSAFLLFQVQPLIAKIILPWFGGSAAVWSAALLFFQLVLLAGYAYAHLLIRFLGRRAQALCHTALLGASCLLLPILPSPSWKPGATGDPTWRILAVLAATVGLPYFLLAATSPLLQAWYVRHRDQAIPYRLFALSNLGSLLALVSFPLVVEPQLGSRHQAFVWSGAYALFAVVCGIVAWAGRRDGAHRVPAASTAVATVAPPRISEMLLWVAFPACASTLLVSVTSHMSQDIAAIPLLWVLPLAVYLMTFILSFESDRLYQRWLFVPLLVPALGAMARFMWAATLGIAELLVIYTVGLFVSCMVCHGEVARRRPAPQYLTTFYLLVALGGALGGVFVAVLAPHVFRTYLELPIGLVACATLAMIVVWNVDLSDVGVWPLRTTVVTATMLLVWFLAREERLIRTSYRLVTRNFYGVLSVHDAERGVDRVRTLFNGTIDHGSQLLDPSRRYAPTDYYGPKSGVGRAISALQAAGPIRIGSIGLGAGVLAAYGRLGDAYRVYEINPLVPEIAQTQFSFYPHSPADKRIVLGDARLTLEREQDQHFDLLSVDAFTGDAIPVHLLTQEAVALYFRHLKPHGILAVHISNWYLDLAPVCARDAQLLGKHAVVVQDDGRDASYLTASTWVLLTDEPSWFQSASFAGATMAPAVASAGFRAWTDDYSNVLQIFHFR